ncbi:MAG: GGDEF domain-containing protein [Burkholderiales bacterium]
MTASQWLLVVFFSQQALFGLLWLAAALLRISRQAAWHWALYAGLTLPAVLLIMSREQVAPWVALGVANLLFLGSATALRRGMAQFARRPPRDVEYVVLLLAGAAATAVMMVSERGTLSAIAVLVGAVVWSVARTADEIRCGLAEEFGRRAALWCALPSGLTALLLCSHIGMAPLIPGLYGSDYARPAGESAEALLVVILVSLLLHLNLCAMVAFRLVRHLQHLSDHDPLTGLLGRRPMEERLQAEALRHSRQGGSFAMLSIDIDHFKQINDRFGHVAGDAVLVRVAHALKHTARAVDSVARMGGEEFGVLLPGCDRAGAHEVALRMLEAVRSQQHAEIDGAMRVTVSIGIAVYDDASETLAMLQRRLDKALYLAKSSGRDQIQLAMPLAALA